MKKSYFLLSLAVMTCVSVVSGCSSPDKKAGAAAAQAQIALASGNAGLALRYIDEAMRERDDVVDYWVLLGRIQGANQNLGGAFYAYENVLGFDQGNLEALRNLCLLGLSVGQPDKVDLYADRLSLLTPDDPLPLTAKGSAALLRGDAEGALKDAELVLAKNPQNVGALILQGRVLTSQGKYLDASKLIEKAPDQGPDGVAKLGFLKELYIRDRDRNSYEQVLTKLASTVPQDPFVQFEYADMLYQSGKVIPARAVVRTVIEKYPQDLNIAALALDVWMREGPDALDPANMQKEASKLSLPMKAAYAQFANETGHPDLALAILGPIGDSVADILNSDALSAHAYAIGLKGRRGDATSKLNDILNVDPSQPRALLARARLEALAHDYRSAVTDARRILADDSQNVVARLALFQILIDSGSSDLAEIALREGVHGSQGDPRLVAALATFLKQRGKGDQVPSLMKDLGRASPINLRVWKLMASNNVTPPLSTQTHNKEKADDDDNTQNSAFTPLGM